MTYSMEYNGPNNQIKLEMSRDTQLTVKVQIIGAMRLRLTPVDYLRLKRVAMAGKELQYDRTM
jgi:hypothetical protein